MQGSPCQNCALLSFDCELLVDDTTTVVYGASVQLLEDTTITTSATSATSASTASTTPLDDADDEDDDLRFLDMFFDLLDPITTRNLLQQW